MANDIYKKFRGVEIATQANTISKRFDEPSYLSFRLQFAPNMDNVYNYASNATGGYDTMPHPLFDIRDFYGETTSGFVGVQDYQRETESYSAYQYLVDANEPTRAALLLDFINKFNVLQEEFPYYFQSIEGLNELIKVDPTKGQRIMNDKKLTITCLEGLDLRMSYLMNLYKKIAWDDVYQRWVLPDMMRYFTLKIFISEFRTFHISQNSTAYGNSQLTPKGVVTPDETPLRQRFNPNTPSKPSGTDIPTYLTILDDILPTWEITCEMCEFDITGTDFNYLSSMNVKDATEAVVKFVVNVGNIKELQIYPSFENRYLSDRKLNGLNRTKDEISTQKDQNNKYDYPASLHIAQNHDGPTEENSHVSGTPYGEFRNNPNIIGIVVQPQSSERLSKNIMGGQNGDEIVKVGTDTQAGWVSNAINWGTSFAKNEVNKILDKAKTTPIPQLGVSFTEIKTALQGKNIIGALGMIRKGVNEVAQSYNNAPSSLLDQPIQTDNIMKMFLQGLSQSEATDEDSIALQQGASLALNNVGVWEQIKDYSMATNLVGRGETNTPVSIKDIPSAKVKPSEKLGSELQKTPTFSSHTIKANDIIEYEPTSVMNSKATNSNLI